MNRREDVSPEERVRTVWHLERGIGGWVRVVCVHVTVPAIWQLLDGVAFLGCGSLWMGNRPV